MAITKKKMAKRKAGSPEKVVKKTTKKKVAVKKPTKRSPKKTKKSVSRSTAKKKAAPKKPHKKTCKKNELADVLDNVKTSRRGKKPEPAAKKLDYENKAITWVTIDENGNELEVRREEGEVVEQKNGKVLGYCPKCNLMISTYDLESKFIFNCGSCGKRARTNKLRKEQRRKDPEYTSKKDYLESTINANHIDMPVHLTHTPKFKKQI